MEQWTLKTSFVGQTFLAKAKALNKDCPTRGPDPDGSASNGVWRGGRPAEDGLAGVLMAMRADKQLMADRRTNTISNTWQH